MLAEVQRHTGVNTSELSPSKDIVPDPVMSESLASANLETKALTTAALEPDTIYTKPGINVKIKNLSRPFPIPYSGNSVFFDYAKKSLSTIGIVYNPRDPDGKITDTFATRSGYMFGLANAWAGHAMDFSLAHPETSLGRLLGGMSSSSEGETIHLPDGEMLKTKKRGPGARYTIFYSLLTLSQPLRVYDLWEDLKDKGCDLQRHLMELARAEVLNYEAVRGDEPFLVFRPTNLEPTPEYFDQFKYRILTSEVYQYVRTQYDIINAERATTKGVSIDQILTDIPVRTNGNYKNGEEAEASKYVTLAQLVEDGFLVVDKFDGKARSRITTSPEQTAILENFVALVDNFQTGGSKAIEQGLEKAKAILADPQKVATLVEKAYRYSSQAHQQPTEVQMRLVEHLLRNENDLESNDIQQLLEDTHDTPLTIQRVREILAKLATLGRATYIQNGQRRKWNITQNVLSI